MAGECASEDSTRQRQPRLDGTDLLADHVPSHAHEGGGRSTVGILGTATALLTLVLMSPASPASSATATAGAWEFYPGQATHVTTTTTTDTAYRTVVRAPINADGSSNWPAKRGVIPVQVDLQAAPGTTTTTTTTYDPPVWQSIGTDSESTNDVTFALFTPSAPMTVSDVTNLSADYAYTTVTASVARCAGPSTPIRATCTSTTGPRTDPTRGAAAPAPDPARSWITTDMTADRFEVEGAGAPVCTDYASAMTLAGARTVNWVQLVVDSGGRPTSDWTSPT